MSPRIQRLRAEIASDLTAYASLIEELAGLPPLTEGSDWHQVLLTGMALDVEGVRPAVLSGATAGALRRLLGFRHYFRHAYAVDLDGARLEELRQVAVSSRAILLSDLKRFDATLAALAGSETSGFHNP